VGNNSPASPAPGTALPPWLTWLIGLLITVLMALNGWAFAYTIGIEHRVTKIETDIDTHINTSDKEKALINRRLDAQALDQRSVLTTITAVAVDVAEIKGYMKLQKENQK